VAFVPSPIVNADHPDAFLGALRTRPALEMAQNRVVARRHANALQEPFARPTSDAVAEQTNKFRHPPSAARKRRGDFRKLLDKRPPAASFVATSPASHSKLHGHPRALRRQVLKPTLMPALPAV
jgi:hypothetical protein